MAVTEKTCAYIKCDLGENGERKKFYTIASGKYCCPKHAQYQRRLDSKANDDLIVSKIKEGE